MTHLTAAAQSTGEVQSALFDHLAAGVAEFDVNGGLLRANRHLHQMLGYSAGGSLPALGDLTHPEDRDVDRINNELMMSGAVDGFRQERRLRRSNGTYLWVDSAMTAIRDEDGTVGRLAAVILDISRAKESEQRQQTLLAELAHRGRNLFTILHSLARHSLTGGRSLSEAYAAFEGRLQALSESLYGLTDRDFAGTRLDLLVRRELHSLGARAVLEGPAVMMTPTAAQTFALVLHELTTNATKYGALSTAEGTLSVVWSVSGTGDAARFAFEWREAGGPPVSPPTRRGFGTVLTIVVAGADFDCEPQASYGADGFAYRFDAPLARLGALVLESPLRRKLKSPIVTALYDGWVREESRAGGLPRFASFDWARFAMTGSMTFGKVQADGSVRITRVGRALVERLGRPLSEEEAELEELDQAREPYRRCARKAAPCHEYLRFNFGTGEPLAFERLLVPFGAPDGPVSHMIGIAIFTGRTSDPGDGATGTRPSASTPEHG